MYKRQALEHILKATPGEELEYLDPGEKAPEGVQVHTTQRGARGYYPSDISDSASWDMSPQEFRNAQVTREQMLERGADGHLSRAVEIQIPISKLEGLEPVPAMEGGYQEGTPITQPIEVVYDRDMDQFTLYAGNHRVQQAKVNGDSTIPAFVEGLRYSEIHKFVEG